MELPYGPAIPFFLTYPKKLNTNLKESMHTYVHYSTIYNSQDLEAAQVSISRRVDTKAVVLLHNGILLSHKKRKPYHL